MKSTKNKPLVEYLIILSRVSRLIILHVDSHFETQVAIFQAKLFSKINLPILQIRKQSNAALRSYRANFCMIYIKPMKG